MIQFHVARENLLKNCSGPCSGAAFIEDYSRLMDERIEGLYKAASQKGAPPGLTLTALGGYGRKHLAPYSDVDLLFLVESPGHREACRDFIEAILYPLWDLKLDVGHAVRTPPECVEAAVDDFATLTTQLDGRFLIGDRSLFAEFQCQIHHWLGAKSRKKFFFKELKRLVNLRHQKYGASPYLLEPNVKEGQGALRDIHAIGWTASALYDRDQIGDLPGLGIITDDMVRQIEEAQQFITDVRIHLHRLAGEKTDTLTFELQEDVSKVLGFKDNGGLSGVERFMREFYTHVYKIKSILDFFVSRVEQDLVPSKIWRLTKHPRRVEKGLTILRGQIELGSREEIRHRPILLMRAFEVSAGSGLPLSQHALELTRTNLDLVDDDFRRDPNVAASFLRGLTAIPPRTSKAPNNLDAMQILSLLEAYIPELAGVRAQVQHDAYHVYTVDVHLIATLWELKKIAMGITQPEVNGYDNAVIEQIQDREALFLAALLHDIGKAHGHDHARRGAEIVPVIAARLGLKPEAIDTVRFLVAEHLYLIEVATRRDLTEEKLIVTCARRVGDVERLNMLYILTVADSRATGPSVLTPWKASLLRDLYSRIYRLLTRSDLAGKVAAEHTEALTNQVREALKDRLPQAEIEDHLEKMSAHYLASTDAEQVVKHIFLERKLGERQLVWEVETKEEGYCEVTIVAHDRPGLLSRMAGVFTLHNINILGAQVFTRANNVALDVFQVESPPDKIYADEAWQRVERDAYKTLTGRLALDYRLARKRPLLETKQVVASRPDEVVVDNDTSDYHTIVEVYTYDRLGLLYAVTQALFDLQLSINLAKISTKVDQVVDVFYVQDFFGQKLVDDDQIRELKDALLFTLKR